MRSAVLLRRALRRALYRRTKPAPRLTAAHALASSLVLAGILFLARPRRQFDPEPLTVVVRSDHPVAPPLSPPSNPGTTSPHPSGSHLSSAIPAPAAVSASAHVPAPYAPLRSRVDAIVGEGAGARRALLRTYGLPYPVVESLTQAVASQLYWKLVYVDVVAALRATGIPSVEGLRPSARALFVHTQNGLGNRLRVLASGLALARATGRVPVVVWERDAHLGASFEELFATDAQGSDMSTVLFKDLIVLPSFPHWSAVSDHSAFWHPVSYMAKDELKEGHRVMRFLRPLKQESTVGLPSPVDLSSPLDSSGATGETQTAVGTTRETLRIDSSTLSGRNVSHDSHVYFKSAYVAETDPRYLSSARVLNRELMRLTPTKAVEDIVSAIDKSVLGKAIGIHIRSRMLDNDNVAVIPECEYTSVGATITDRWRSQSQLHVFQARMQRLMERPAERKVKFFVAADDVEVVRKLENAFPGRILSIPRTCDDRRRSCVLYAMADLLSLSRTRKIYGSNWSSFTEAAGRMGGKTVYLSGISFGRRKPRRRFQWYPHEVRATIRRFVRKIWAPYTNCRNR